MSFGPIRPARVDFSAGEPPRSPAYGDIYHPRAGAWAQARHVFLAGNGLPQRWAGRPRFVVLETGFGLGHNFLATWEAWRADPQRCRQLVFVSIEKHPLTRADLRRAHADSPMPALAEALLAAWPPLTPDIHLMDFDGGQVRLHLVLADVSRALPELVLQADAFYLDGFAPSRNPDMWDHHRLRALARLAAPGASVATWSVARELRDGLSAAGFRVDKAPGVGGKREITVGRFSPHHRPAPPPGRMSPGAGQVTVVGAGLAGAGVARALAMQGVQVDVLEQHPGAAQATSGNPGGLYHGIVHAHDGPHARWLRAAALEAQRVIAPAVAQGRLPGAPGLLRGERQLGIEAMRALLAAQALPAEWVQALDADQATALTGLAPTGPAWHYPGGGWVSPAALVASWLAAPNIRLHTRCPVARLQAGPAGWQLLGADGQVLQQAEAVVVANAADAMHLLGQPAWPWQSLRGQVTMLDDPWPALPLAVADQGYALRLADGRLLCGATSQADDDDAGVRADDHAHNLATLRRLTGWPVPDAGLALRGRVGWRMQPADRLPMLGPVPSAGPPPAHRADQPRFAPRVPGLFVACGYGARGITHAALAGEVLAAWITGAPMPAPASLLDALDPARFAARLNRKPAS
ncbi:MAG: FAD-dependent 5-carboxymethylaminomethyl-2-thiouridine(34) oxidoreductase MnmC [Burkholderiales bacterium]|nr:FAD-dependent 5-carboxymethylaminomethyl-2-thiouridine(34) oxidoreductase MnmC [Burkholderiales bacterium]